MTTDTVGGVWTYSLQLAKSLAEHNVRVELATLGRRLTPPQRQDAITLENISIHESSYRLEWMKDPWDDVRAAGEWLLTLAEEVCPDLVHLNDYSQGVLNWSVPVLAVGHSCVLSWHEAVRSTPAGPEWSTYREHVSRGLQGADLVVAPTSTMLEWLRAIYGPFRSSEVISNGRDRPPGAGKGKRPIVLTAGRIWDEAKNIRVLENAARDVSWPVCVAGESVDPTGRVATFANITMLGRLDAGVMNDWFQAASIYVHPARYEPFGLAPLEAAQQGCALVLADIPTLREVWGKNALFVPPAREAEWTGTINRLIARPPLLREYAERARRRATLYTAECMAREYMKAYHRLLDGSGIDQYDEGPGVQEPIASDSSSKFCPREQDDATSLPRRGFIT